MWCASLFVFGFLIPALGYGVLSQKRFGFFSMSSTNGGLSLIEGKCPAKFNIDSTGAGWFSPLFVQIGENEKKVWPRPFYDQNYFLSEGLKCIQARPVVMLESVRYVYYLFLGNLSWPSNVTKYKRLNQEYEMFFVPLILPGFLLFILVWLNNPLQPWSPPFLMMLSLFLNSWLFKSEFRYRVPFDVVLIPLIVVGWNWALKKCFPKKGWYLKMAALGASVVGCIAVFVSLRLYWGY